MHQASIIDVGTNGLADKPDAKIHCPEVGRRGGDEGEEEEPYLMPTRRGARGMKCWRLNVA